MKASQTQFKIMLDFMEKHGDLSHSRTEGPKSRMENLQRWYELVELLNAASEGEPKPLMKWRKVWSDYKNNTRKKLHKISKQEARNGLSKLEKKVLKFVKDSPPTAHEDSSANYYKEESEHSLEKNETPQRIFCLVDGETSNRCSMLSETSSETPLLNKKDRESNIEEQMKELTEKFLELEKQREKMAHDREMARIRQNDQFLAVFGRIVNVLETLAPSMQRYLDQSANR